MNTVSTVSKACGRPCRKGRDAVSQFEKCTHSADFDGPSRDAVRRERFRSFVGLRHASRESCARRDARPRSDGREAVVGQLRFRASSGSFAPAIASRSVLRINAELASAWSPLPNPGTFCGSPKPSSRNSHGIWNKTDFRRFIGCKTFATCPPVSSFSPGGGASRRRNGVQSKAGSALRPIWQWLQRPTPRQFSTNLEARIGISRSPGHNAFAHWKNYNVPSLPNPGKKCIPIRLHLRRGSSKRISACRVARGFSAAAGLLGLNPCAGFRIGSQSMALSTSSHGSIVLRKSDCNTQFQRLANRCLKGSQRC